MKKLHDLAIVLIKKTSSFSIEFSIELQRTLKSNEHFEKVKDFVHLESNALEYFSSNQHQKPMREGHLKQSFIYMLIDPRISCNLPGESMASSTYPSQSQIHLNISISYLTFSFWINSRSGDVFYPQSSTWARGRQIVPIPTCTRP